MVGAQSVEWRASNTVDWALMKSQALGRLANLNGCSKRQPIDQTRKMLQDNKRTQYSQSY